MQVRAGGHGIDIVTKANSGAEVAQQTVMQAIYPAVNRRRLTTRPGIVIVNDRAPTDMRKLLCAIYHSMPSSNCRL